jgi:hypothetical protein
MKMPNQASFCAAALLPCHAAVAAAADAAASLTISKPVCWDELIVIEAGKGFDDDDHCLLVGVRVWAQVVQAAAREGLLARPLIALRQVLPEHMPLRYQAGTNNGHASHAVL